MGRILVSVAVALLVSTSNGAVRAADLAIPGYHPMPGESAPPPEAPPAYKPLLPPPAPAQPTPSPPPVQPPPVVPQQVVPPVVISPRSTPPKFVDRPVEVGPKGVTPSDYILA